MNKAMYVVTSSQYGNRKIWSIFSSISNAQFFVDSFNDDLRDVRIEEYELDLFVTELKGGYSPFFVRMTKDREIVSIILAKTVSL